MFNRFLLAVLLMATSLAVWAEETTILGIHGSWWNPLYAGEGFAFEQYDDGLVIGYWYTYDDMGNQMWLIGTGTLDGNFVTLDMVRTEGGGLGSRTNPGDVTEEPWGTVELELVSCNEILMTYEGGGNKLGGYKLERIVPQGLTGLNCEEPQITAVRLQQQSITGQWNDVSLPLVGALIRTIENAGSGPFEILRMRLIAEEGEIRVATVNAKDSSGRTTPYITGITAGQIIQQGGIVRFSLWSDSTNGIVVDQEYSLFLFEVGEIMNITVRLLTSD